MLTVFGEVPEDIQKRCKYAKWKAIYISRCLKNGETPIPGPVAGTDAEDLGLPDIPSDGNQNNYFEDQKPSVPSDEPSFPTLPSVPSEPKTEVVSEYRSGGVTHSVLSAMSKKTIFILIFIIKIYSKQI